MIAEIWRTSQGRTAPELFVGRNAGVLAFGQIMFGPSQKELSIAHQTVGAFIITNLLELHGFSEAVLNDLEGCLIGTYIDSGRVGLAVPSLQFPIHPSEEPLPPNRLPKFSVALIRNREVFRRHLEGMPFDEHAGHFVDSRNSLSPPELLQIFYIPAVRQHRQSKLPPKFSDQHRASNARRLESFHRTAPPCQMHTHSITKHGDFVKPQCVSTTMHFCYSILKSMPSLRILISLSLILSSFALINPLRAAVLETGDLIKTDSLPDVYYYGADGMRYVFPNEKTYFSWYAGFDTKTITAQELAMIRVGGAVTYKPGYKMVKVTTDPKVYAVAKGGVLRWIETEGVAVQLYGADWNTKIHDLPDAYFATYKVGTSIARASDYSAVNELAVTSISADKNLIAVPPVTPPTNQATLDFSVARTSVKPGDIEILSATASDPSGIFKIELYFDNVLINTCPSTSCSGETQIPISGTLSSYEAKVIATAQNATTQTKTATVALSSADTSLITIAVGRPVIRSGQLAEAIADISPAVAAIRTDIYLNGNSVEACASGIRQCRWTDTLTGTVPTTFDLYAKVTDTLGRVFSSAHKTVTISDNDSPLVHLTLGKTLIYVNETVDMSVTASDDDGIKTVEILKDGVVQKTCITSICNFVTEPMTSAGTVSYTARATDALNLQVTTEAENLTIVRL